MAPSSLNEQKRPRGDWPVWVGGVLLLMLAYGGAYAAIVSPHSEEFMCFAFVVYPMELDCQYSENEDFDHALTMFFLPAHEIDLRLRFRYWHVTDEHFLTPPCPTK